MIEAEIKLKIENPQQLIECLRKCGFAEGKIVREEDIYYNSPEHDFRKRDEALRTRKITDLRTGKSHSRLTYKGPKLDSATMTRKELETGIEDAEITAGILDALGYTEKYPVIKIRHYYNKEKLTACVDEVEGLGDFLELETLVSEEESFDTAKAVLARNLEELGYTMSQTTRTSYLTMLMNLATGTNRKE